MLIQIFSLLLDVATGLLAGACLLRLYMQYQRIPFGNPIGRFVFAVTDWLVLPLRKVLPAIGRIDTASLVAVYLVELAYFLLLWLVAGRGGGLELLPLLALFGLVRLIIWAAIALLFVYVILSWTGADSPGFDLIERFCNPLLRPFRKLVPLVGGVDLSPLALSVVLYIGLIVLAYAEPAVIRLVS